MEDEVKNKEVKDRRKTVTRDEMVEILNGFMDQMKKYLESNMRYNEYRLFRGLRNMRDADYENINKRIDELQDSIKKYCTKEKC